jgi:hypothetical protein
MPSHTLGQQILNSSLSLSLVTADLQALKESEQKATSDDNGIDTPGHSHHFANKGIDPIVLNSSLKKHIALGAHQGERRLNDFSADPTDRLNPHFADAIERIKDTTVDTGGSLEPRYGAMSDDKLATNVFPRRRISPS